MQWKGDNITIPLDILNWLSYLIHLGHISPVGGMCQSILIAKGMTK